MRGPCRGMLAVLACLAALLVACGGGQQVVVSERVTSDFGRELISERGGVTLEAGQTALDMLERHHDVSLSEGGMVLAIDGVAADDGDPDGRRWTLAVNGIAIDGSPERYELHSGDVVQWDLRGGPLATAVGATVGAYPETFVRGLGGRPPIATVGCANPSADGCRRMEAALPKAGVVMRDSATVRAAGEAGGDADGGGGLRAVEVLVGAWHHLAGHEWARLLVGTPRRSGIFLRVRPGPDELHYGDRLQLLDAHGKVARTLGRGVGLVAAMRPTDGYVLWLITGVDSEGADLAARALTRGKLRDTAAAIVTAQGVEPLPVVESPAT